MKTGSAATLSQNFNHPSFTETKHAGVTLAAAE